MLAIEYHFHIWQVSPQLSCGGTSQIWRRFKECNRYFCEIKNFAYGEIEERSFSNPPPQRCWWGSTGVKQKIGALTHRGLNMKVNNLHTTFSKAFPWITFSEFWLEFNWKIFLRADDKSILCQVMAWCRQASSHYLQQCWPKPVAHGLLHKGTSQLNWYIKAHLH